MAAVLGIAWVVHSVEGVFEASQGVARESAAGTTGAFGDALAVFFGQGAGLAEDLLGVFLQGTDPKLFGALEVLIEVGAVTLEAFGEAQRGPVGDFVEGALVDGWIMEAFGEKRTVTVLLFPLVLKSAQGQTETLAGEVGTAGPLWNKKAAELDNELEAVGAGHGIPANPGVAVLEALGSPCPRQHGHQFVAPVLKVLLVNALPEQMSGGTPGLEVVLFVENRSELADFERLGGGANVENGIHLNPSGEAYRGGHDMTTMQNRGAMSSQKVKI